MPSRSPLQLFPRWVRPRRQPCSENPTEHVQGHPRVGILPERKTRWELFLIFGRQTLALKKAFHVVPLEILVGTFRWLMKVKFYISLSLVRSVLGRLFTLSLGLLSLFSWCVNKGFTLFTSSCQRKYPMKHFTCIYKKYLLIIRSIIKGM